MMWKHNILDNIAEFIGRGRSPVYVDKSEYPVINQACIQWDELELSRVKYVSKEHFESLDLARRTQPGDVFINSTGVGTLGRIGYWPFEQSVAYDSHVTVLRLKPGFDSQFFFYWLKTPEAQQQIENECITGSTNQTELSREAFRRIKVRYPENVSEQSAIARVLATLDRAIEQSEALVAKYRRIKTGLMHDLLTRGIDDHGNLRDPATHRFKDSPLGRVPVEWEVCPLSKLAEIHSGVTLGRQVSGDATIELPYLRVANVQDGYIDLSDIKTVRVYKQEIPRYLLQTGDVLMNEGGDFDKLGRGTVWRGQISPCLHQNHVFRVRANRDLLSPDFLAYISASPYGKKFFVLSSKQSTNLASINSTQLKGFPVPRPPIEEQEKIVRFVQKLDQTLNAENAYLSKLRRLKTGLMHDLLTGRVPVAPLLEGDL